MLTEFEPTLRHNLDKGSGLEYAIDTKFLQSLKLEPIGNGTLVVWNDVPEKGNMCIYFADTGVQVAVGDRGDGLVWTHHFQPNGLTNFVKGKEIEFVKRYTRGMILLLNWFRNINEFKRTTGFENYPVRLYGSTNKRMCLFRQKLLGENNVVVDNVYGDPPDQDYWYHMNLSKMLSDTTLEQRLTKIATR